MISYSKYFVDRNDIDIIIDVLRNKSTTQGEIVYNLERNTSISL